MGEPALSNDSLADLQNRLAGLELDKSHNDCSAVLRQERAEMLVSVRQITEAIKREADIGGGGGGASNKELEKLKADNKMMKKTIDKQQYRIEHLVHNLRITLDGGKP